MSEQRPEPTEDEIREALEQQLRSLRVEDVVLQTIATLINIAVMRLGLTGDAEKDMDQAKLAIDAARALIPVTPEDQSAAVQDALSQVQMAFAREATGAQPSGATPEGPAEPAEPAPGAEGDAEREKARSKIWTPPGS